MLISYILVSENARILLANPLQSSRSTFSRGSLSAFLPSKKACWAYQFRYLEVSQQYPPVIGTQYEGGNAAGTTCAETQYINQCRVGGWPGSF
jgi:hypothetical protein